MKLLEHISNIFNKKNELDNKSRGELGEKKACKFIKKNGYEVLEKNYRTKFGEIDIVASEHETICFIEVKARSNSDYGNPEEFVTKKKQEKLWKTASIYIDNNPSDLENYRFDVIAIDFESNNVEIFKNAFEPEVSF